MYNNSLNGVNVILFLAKSSTSYNVVVTSYNEVCAYIKVIEHYNQLDAAYKETLKLFILVGWGRSFLSVAWPTGVQLMFFFSSGVSKLFGAQGSPSSGSLLNL